MLIHKIFLKAGQIESQRELQSNEMDHALLRQARQTMSALRAGRVSDFVPLAGGSEIVVSLGINHGGYSETYEKRMLQDWQAHYPEADISEYDREIA